MIHTSHHHVGYWTHLTLQRSLLRHNESQMTQKRQREGILPRPPSRGANLYTRLNEGSGDFETGPEGPELVE